MHDRDFGGEQILDLLFRALKSETQLLQKQNLAVVFGYVRVQIVPLNVLRKLFLSGKGCRCFFVFFKGTHLGPSHIGGGDPASAPQKKKPGLVHRAEPSEGCRGTIFPVSHDTSV